MAIKIHVTIRKTNGIERQRGRYWRDIVSDVFAELSNHSEFLQNIPTDTLRNSPNKEEIKVMSLNCIKCLSALNALLLKKDEAFNHSSKGTVLDVLTEAQQLCATLSNQQKSIAG